MNQSPKTLIATFFDYEIPIKQQLELIFQAGFTHVSLSVRPDHSLYLETQGRTLLKGYLKEKGLSIDTVHGQTFKDDSSLDEAISTIHAAADSRIETSPSFILEPLIFPLNNFLTVSSSLLESLSRLSPFSGILLSKLLMRMSCQTLLQNLLVYFSLN